MMKKIIIGSILIILIFLIVGCVDISPPINEVPQDLVIEYEPVCGFCPPGETKVTINADGAGTVIKSLGVFEKEYIFSVSKEEILDIVNTAKRNGFFAMAENNTNPNVMDGGGNRIIIKMNNSTKNVLVFNYDWPNFYEIVNKIRVVSTERLGISYWGNEELLDQCDSIDLICDGNTSHECNFSRSYCEGKRMN